MNYSDPTDFILEVLESGRGLFCSGCNNQIDLEADGTFSAETVDGWVSVYCSKCSDERVDIAIKEGRLFECSECGFVQDVARLHSDRLCISCHEHNKHAERLWEEYVAQRQPEIRKQWLDAAEAVVKLFPRSLPSVKFIDDSFRSMEIIPLDGPSNVAGYDQADLARRADQINRDLDEIGRECG